MTDSTTIDTEIDIDGDTIVPPDPAAEDQVPVDNGNANQASNGDNKEQELEIVDARLDFTDEQDDVIEAFYNHLAHLIPENGRDYRVRFNFAGRSTKCSVTITGMTRVGIAFAKELKNYFTNEQN